MADAENDASGERDSEFEALPQAVSVGVIDASNVWRADAVSMGARDIKGDPEVVGDTNGEDEGDLLSEFEADGDRDEDGERDGVADSVGLKRVKEGDCDSRVDALSNADGEVLELGLRDNGGDRVAEWDTEGREDSDGDAELAAETLPRGDIDAESEASALNECERDTVFDVAAVRDGLNVRLLVHEPVSLIGMEYRDVFVSSIVGVMVRVDVMERVGVECDDTEGATVADDDGVRAADGVAQVVSVVG